MRFHDLDKLFGSTDLGPNMTSEEFTLADGHRYYLVRSRLADDSDYVFTLFCMDSAERHTMYVSRGAMLVLLARRDGERLKQCPDCNGTGSDLNTLAEPDATGAGSRCGLCEGRGVCA